MKLIDEAKHAWRMFSVQAMTAAGAIQGAYAYLTPEQKAAIGHTTVAGVTIGLLVLGIVGRLVRQDSIPTPKPTNTGEQP
jgi:hypothetical protein